MSFGEVAEWSIAAVLKTVELRGSGGSNPSLSALNSLQGVDFQPCRLFLCPKSCTKNAPTPFLRTSTGVFQIAHISHFLSHFLVLPSIQYNTTIFISTRHSVRHYSGYFEIIILLVGNNLPISNLVVENCYPLKLLPILQQRSKFM